MRCSRLFTPLLLGALAFVRPAQTSAKTVRCIGTFSDGLTTLQLRADSSFLLNEWPGDRAASTVGVWTLRGDTVILNPGKDPRYPTVSGVEAGSGAADSLTVRIRYQKAYYREEVLQATAVAPLDGMTVFANTRKNFQSLVYPGYRSGPRCLLAPPIRRPHLIDTSNTVRICKKDLSRLGFCAYGWPCSTWLPVRPDQADTLDVLATLPVEELRQPRFKRVLIRKSRVLCQDMDGGFSTSWMEGLWRRSPVWIRQFERRVAQPSQPDASVR